MKWTIQQLNTKKNKGITIDEVVDVSDLSKMNSEIRQISPVHVKGNGEFSSHAITFTLNISGELVIPCSRTLRDVSYPFDIKAREMFKLHDWAGFDEDDEVHDLENDTVNLLPYIKEAILLEIPLQVFCEGIEGEVPPSGDDWELLTDETKKNRIDPRLADLAKFFENK